MMRVIDEVQRRAVLLLAELRGKGVVGGLLASALLKLLWDQYGVLLRRRLPKYLLELPLVGGNLQIFRQGYQSWAQQLQQPALLSSIFCMNTVVVSWPVYEQYVKKADAGGLLDQGGFPSFLIKLLGENSLLLMKAGRGQAHHALIRSKVLSALTPKRMLALVPDMASIIRDELSSMAAAKQPCAFVDVAGSVATRVSCIPILGGLPQHVQQQLQQLFMVWTQGLVATPVDLGSWSAYGRALQARGAICAIMQEIMAKGATMEHTALRELVSADGGKISEGEIMDSVFTLLFAGQFTTTEALPCLLAELASRPEWRAKIAAEPLAFEAPEADSATLRFVREVLRLNPPEVLFFRQNTSSDIELGEHGIVPRGCTVAMNFGQHMWSFGGNSFDPDRWGPHNTERERFLTFGGHSPHNCVGRGLAMLEMQTFCRVVAREYDVEVLDDSKVRNWALGGITFKYKDDLLVRVSPKADSKA